MQDPSHISHGSNWGPSNFVTNIVAPFLCLSRKEKSFFAYRIQGGSSQAQISLRMCHKTDWSSSKGKVGRMRATTALAIGLAVCGESCPPAALAPPAVHILGRALCCFGGNERP